LIKTIFIDKDLILNKDLTMTTKTDIIKISINLGLLLESLFSKIEGPLHLYGSLIRIMVKKNKPKQLKAKEFQEAQSLLDSVIAILDSIPQTLKPFITQILIFLNRLKDILSTAAPVKDSSNSHLPSGRDINKASKPREKGKHPLGGQDGHEGSTHQLEIDPDQTLDLTPKEYINNPDWHKIGTIRRQVLDVTLQKKVTQYRIDIFENIYTGEKTEPIFPDGVKAPVQFGPEVRSFVVYLREHNHLSYERIAALITDIFKISICPATIKNIIEEAENSVILDRFEEAAKKDIIGSNCVNADETGVSVGGTNHWVHLLISPVFSLFYLIKERGKSAMDAIGIISKLKGFLVHDCWASYFLFTNCCHCLCNAHFLRDLNAAVQMSQSWASDMIEFLLDLNDTVNSYGGELPLNIQTMAKKEYRRILEIGIEATGGRKLARPPGLKRGRMKKPPYRNLLERLMRFEDEVLRFMTSREVPFTNNDAERPVRMIKVHLKISGCFRSLKMAQGFCRMRSYIVSSQKNGINAYQAIKMLMNDETPKYIDDALAKESNENDANNRLAA
jgi:transposase